MAAEKNIKFFTGQNAFRKWLEKNHATKTELLVGFYKKNSGKANMTWSESVDQALCFGWIDGVTKSIDEESYFIRFTPRKSTSIWSAVNIKKMKILTKAGLMTSAGEKAFKLRTKERSKIYSHENAAADLDKRFVKIFKKEKQAWDFFNAQAPSYKKVIIHWISTAKKEETRLSRLQKVILFSSKNMRVP